MRDTGSAAGQSLPVVQSSRTATHRRSTSDSNLAAPQDGKNKYSDGHWTCSLCSFQHSVANYSSICAMCGTNNEEDIKEGLQSATSSSSSGGDSPRTPRSSGTQTTTDVPPRPPSVSVEATPVITNKHAHGLQEHSILQAGESVRDDDDLVKQELSAKLGGFWKIPQNESGATAVAESAAPPLLPHVVSSEEEEEEEAEQEIGDVLDELRQERVQKKEYALPSLWNHLEAEPPSRDSELLPRPADTDEDGTLNSSSFATLDDTTLHEPSAHEKSASDVNAESQEFSGAEAMVDDHDADSANSSSTEVTCNLSYTGTAGTVTNEDYDNDAGSLSLQGGPSSHARQTYPIGDEESDEEDDDFQPRPLTRLHGGRKGSLEPASRGDHQPVQASIGLDDEEGSTGDNSGEWIDSAQNIDSSRVAKGSIPENGVDEEEAFSYPAPIRKGAFAGSSAASSSTSPSSARRRQPADIDFHHSADEWVNPYPDMEEQGPKSSFLFGGRTQQRHQDDHSDLHDVEYPYYSGGGGGGGHDHWTPYQRKSRAASMTMYQKRRRRMAIIFFVLVIIGVIVGVTVSVNNRDRGGSSSGSTLATSAPTDAQLSAPPSLRPSASTSIVTSLPTAQPPDSVQSSPPSLVATEAPTTDSTFAPTTSSPSLEASAEPTLSPSSPPTMTTVETNFTDLVSLFGTSENQRFGSDVAISPDGGFLLVASLSEMELFQISENGVTVVSAAWPNGSDIVVSNQQEIDLAGYDAAVVFLATESSVQILEYTNGSWTVRGGQQSPPQWVSTVAIRRLSSSHDGTKVAVASLDAQTGSIFSGVWEWMAGSDEWVETGLIDEWEASGGAARTSVLLSLSGSGSTMAVGSLSFFASPAVEIRVYDFDETDGRWVLRPQSLTVAVGPVELSLSFDGLRLGIASTFTTRVYEWNQDQLLWDTLGAPFPSSVTLDLSRNGDRVVVGSLASDSATIFDLENPSGGPTQWVPVRGFQGNEGDQFGSNVGISEDGNAVVVAAPRDSQDGPNFGAVSVYT